jgi:hypothetical protein
MIICAIGASVLWRKNIKLNKFKNYPILIFCIVILIFDIYILNYVVG